MELLLPLVSFAFVSSITPGPNNVMLSASAVAFGLKRTLPHLAGVAIGFAGLLALCGSGIGTLIGELPAAGIALKSLGSAYLIYLAWSLRNALAPRPVTSSARPMTFMEAVLFQFVNPKAWVMALTAVSAFVPEVEPRWLGVGIVCGVFTLVNVPCISTWAVLGATLRRWLAHDRWRRGFSAAIVVLMCYAGVAIWL